MGKIHKKRIFMKEKSIIQQNLKKIIGVIVVSVFAIITIYTVFRGERHLFERTDGKFKRGILGRYSAGIGKYAWFYLF